MVFQCETFFFGPPSGRFFDVKVVGFSIDKYKGFLKLANTHRFRVAPDVSVAWITWDEICYQMASAVADLDRCDQQVRERRDLYFSALVLQAGFDVEEILGLRSVA